MSSSDISSCEERDGKQVLVLSVNNVTCETSASLKESSENQESCSVSSSQYPTPSVEWCLLALNYIFRGEASYYVKPSLESGPLSFWLAGCTRAEIDFDRLHLEAWSTWRKVTRTVRFSPCLVNLAWKREDRRQKSYSQVFTKYIPSLAPRDMNVEYDTDIFCIMEMRVY